MKIARSRSISAVLVVALGANAGQVHATYDDYAARKQFIGWEGHDEGDTHPNTDTTRVVLGRDLVYAQRSQMKKQLNILVWT